MVMVDWYNRYIKVNKERQRELILGLLVVVGVGGWYGYRWYSQQYNGKAQYALARGMDLYTRALNKDDKALWHDARKIFADGYRRYARSSLAPYFLAFEAEAARRLGEEAKAFELMEQAVVAAASNSLLKGMYEVKLALMKIDAREDAVRQQGAKALKELVAQRTGETRDMATFYEGLIAFDRGERAVAEEVWKSLFNVSGDRKKSLWADMAQEKLDYLV